MSWLRLAPKIGHQERLKRLYGYVSKTNTFLLGTEQKNTTTFTYQNKNMIGLEQSMQMLNKKLQKTSKLLGSRVITTTFLYANLLHDIVTGRSITVVLHFLNTTPIDW